MVKRSTICSSITALLFISTFVFSTSRADDSALDKAVKSFGAKQVEGYVQPLADIFGANMGAGWYRSAEIPTTGFNFSFNIVAMGSIIGDDQKTYTAKSPPGFNPSTFQTATVFGKDGQTVTDQQSGMSYRGSNGAVNASLFPLAALQVNIGSIYGTQFTIRGLPIPAISGAPSVSYWGGGVRHSISQYMGVEPPVHIALALNYSKISFGDIISISNFGVGPQISKKFSIVELYGGIGYEKSSMHITYNPTDGSTPVDITLDGANTFRGTIGLVLNLAILHLHADANFGSITNFSTGIGFGF